LTEVGYVDHETAADVEADVVDVGRGAVEDPDLPGAAV